LFHAYCHLGDTLWFCFRFEEAKEHQEKAVVGLKHLLGEADLKTLIAIESLSRTYRSLGVNHLEFDGELGRQYLGTAERNMVFVVDERTKQLGDKQPYTWLAKCNLGAIKGAMGEVEEGERLISSLIPIASAHLGDDHLGVLAGRNELARILMKQKRLFEAEDTLRDITRPEKYRKTATATGEHPDRCDALWTLVECYQLQNKIDDGLRTCDELEAAIIAIGRGERHEGVSSRFWQMIQDKREALKAANKGVIIRNTLSLEAGSLTEEFQLPSLQFGLLAISSDAQIVGPSGSLRQRHGTKPPEYHI